jgi:dolichol-phosphate mannosyltransferase
MRLEGEQGSGGMVGGGGAFPAGLVGALPTELVERRPAPPVAARPDELEAASAITREWLTGNPPAPASCTFVVPAYNEEDNILRLLDDFAARSEQLPVGSRVIVVDDGSDDSTPELVAQYTGPIQVELVALTRNQGPGAAFRAGFAAALANCSEDAYIVTLEADTTSDLDALPEMLARVDAGADLVLAHWRMIDVSRRRRLLSASAGYVVRRALGLDATTVSSFYRVYRASILRAASERYGDHLIQESGFACKAEILAKIAAMGARVDEVTVDLNWSRRNGESKMPVARTMLAYWRMMFRQRTYQEPA